MSEGPDDILKILREMKEELRERYHIRRIGVFGSRARSESSDDSDLDLLVEFDEEAQFGILRFIEIEESLSELFGIKVDLIEKSALKPAIGERIIREVIYA